MIPTSKNRQIHHTGLRPRPQFEQIVDYLENGQERVKFPDREAKFVRDHPFMTQLDFFDMQEEQQKAWEAQQRKMEARDVAEEMKTSEASVMATSQREPEFFDIFDTADVGVGEHDPNFIRNWDELAERATDVFEAETSTFETNDRSKKDKMALTMSYGLRQSMENPASSIFDYVVAPNDPEPGPDGRFHWSTEQAAWDPLRARWRGRYREMEPIRNLQPALPPQSRENFDPLNYIRTRGPDGEFVKIWLLKGAETSMSAASYVGKSIYEKVRPATQDEREFAEELRQRERDYKEFEKQERELALQERRREKEERNMMALMNRQAEEAARAERARTKAQKTAEYEAELKRKNQLAAARETVEQRFPSRREALNRSMSSRKAERTYAPVREGEGESTAKFNRATGSIGRFLTGR